MNRTIERQVAKVDICALRIRAIHAWMDLAHSRRVHAMHMQCWFIQISYFSMDGVRNAPIIESMLLGVFNAQESIHQEDGQHAICEVSAHI